MKVGDKDFDSVLKKYGMNGDVMLKAAARHFPNAEVKHMDLPNDSDDVFGEPEVITVDLATEHPNRCANAILRRMRQQKTSAAMIAVGVAHKGEIKIIEAKEPVRVVQMRNMVKQQMILEKSRSGQQ